MQVSQVITVTISADQEETEIPELTGQKAPAAFILNYGAHGYGKFVISPESLAVFES